MNETAINIIIATLALVAGFFCGVAYNLRGVW